MLDKRVCNRIVYGACIFFVAFFSTHEISICDEIVSVSSDNESSRWGLLPFIKMISMYGIAFGNQISALYTQMGNFTYNNSNMDQEVSLKCSQKSEESNLELITTNNVDFYDKESFLSGFDEQNADVVDISWHRAALKGDLEWLKGRKKELQNHVEKIKSVNTKNKEIVTVLKTLCPSDIALQIVYSFAGCNRRTVGFFGNADVNRETFGCETMQAGVKALASCAIYTYEALDHEEQKSDEQTIISMTTPLSIAIQLADREPDNPDRIEVVWELLYYLPTPYFAHLTRITSPWLRALMASYSLRYKQEYNFFTRSFPKNIMRNQSDYNPYSCPFRLEAYKKCFSKSFQTLFQSEMFIQRTYGVFNCVNFRSNLEKEVTDMLKNDEEYEGGIGSYAPLYIDDGAYNDLNAMFRQEHDTWTAKVLKLY